jgi:lipoate-protein ligase A
LSLQQIRIVLERAPRELPDALRLQRQVLEEKQRHLARALSATIEAEKSIRPGEPVDLATLKRLIETITQRDEADVFRKYWSDEEWAKYEMASAQIMVGIMSP